MYPMGGLSCEIVQIVTNRCAILFSYPIKEDHLYSLDVFISIYTRLVENKKISLHNTVLFSYFKVVKNNTKRLRVQN
jgi:hypothetical protein